MISGPEITVIAVIALLLFGPDKIPQVVQTVKKAVGFYTEARDQVTDVVTTHVISQEDLDTIKDPLGLGDTFSNSKGSGGSKDLLSPQRKALYRQNASAPAKLNSADADAALAATSPEAFGAETETPATAPSEAGSPAAPTSAEQRNDVTPSVGDTPNPRVREEPAEPAPATVVEPDPVPKTAAESIWASLEAPRD